MRGSSGSPQAWGSPAGSLAGGLRPHRRQTDTPCRESSGIEFIHWVMEGKGRREYGSRHDTLERWEIHLPLQKWEGWEWAKLVS